MGGPISPFLLARSNLESGERERIIRGGSFLTSIRAKDEALERLENAESASWELGFRCVVTRAEVERQLRILPLIEDLGWRDPYHWFQRVRPARRKLVQTGPEALPYLEQARDRCRLSWLRERLSGLIDEIRRKT